MTFASPNHTLEVEFMIVYGKHSKMILLCPEHYSFVQLKAFKRTAIITVVLSDDVVT